MIHQDCPRLRATEGAPVALTKGGAGPATNPSVCVLLATVAEVALGFPRVDA